MEIRSKGIGGHRESGRHAIFLIIHASRGETESVITMV
jgi:hypothetical protein